LPLRQERYVLRVHIYEAAAAATDSAPSANRPVDKVRIGSVNASIWRNSGEKGDFYSVTFEHSYKDGQEWKTANSYGQGDLLELVKAADKAHDRILELQGKGRG
jgi:hypothetical protein